MTTKSSRNDEVTMVRSVGRNDVLFGRGRRSYNHQGNVFFRSFVAEKALAYKANENRSYRRATAATVIAKVKKNNGLFLHSTELVNDDGQLERCWKTVSMPIVMTKVKQALRDMGEILSLKSYDEIKMSSTSHPAKVTQESNTMGAGESKITHQLPGLLSAGSVWQPTVVSPAPQRQSSHLAEIIEEETRKLRVLQLRRHQAEYSLALLDEQKRSLMFEYLLGRPRPGLPPFGVML